MSEDIFPAEPTVAVRIGQIVSVAASEVIMLCEQSGSDAASQSDAMLQLGTLVKMQTASSAVYGLVSSLTVPAPNGPDGDDDMKVAEIELLGEAVARDGDTVPSFQRGVSVYPSLGNSVFLTGKEDLELVYSAPDVDSIKIGALHQDGDVPASVMMDKLLGEHFAILGTTGSGKSCAITLILRSTLERHKHGHILLLDLHNEYASAFSDVAEVLDTNNLELPYWFLNFEELKEIVVSESDKFREAESSILAEVVTAAKQEFASALDSHKDIPITVDTPVPYRLGDVHRLIDQAAGKLEKPNDTAPYIRLRSKLKSLQADKRYSFMFQSLTVRDNMSAILARVFRLPVDDRPMTIVDISGVPAEILNVVVSVLCRMTFDFVMWSKQTAPVLLVCEEAHRYAPRDDSRGFGPARRALSRIAKEGRKYGVSLCVMSQRPSELDMSVLSQCNTIFALRMTNRRDRDFVGAAIAESGVGLLDFLPSLRNGEAIAIGEGVPVPVRISFDRLDENERPRSGTVSFSATWGDETNVASAEKIVSLWRRQGRKTA